MGKSTTLESFFKRKATQNPEVDESSYISASTTQLINDEQHQSKMSRVEKEEVDISLLEKDPGKRPPIWQYPVDQRDEIQISYLKNGPYQPCLTKYPASGKNHPRRFQYSWFAKFPSWLEYSLEKDAAFCLPCYLFSNNSGCRNNGKDAFTEKGFRAWRKVSGKNCAFLSHMGSSPNSPHNVCVQRCDDLMVQSQHIEKVFRQSEQIIANTHLRLKTSIMAVRWLTFQACDFRGSEVNEISTLQLTADTRWGCHLNYIRSLLCLFEATCEVLQKTSKEATSERSFSTMNIVKKRLRNKMEDGFMADCLVTYIERNIAEKFDFDSIIDEFIDMKKHHA